MTHQLPDLPENMFNAGLKYTVDDKFSARLWMNYVDKREHFSGGELNVLDSYTLVNAAADYRIFKSPLAKLNLYLAAENISMRTMKKKVIQCPAQWSSEAFGWNSKKIVWSEV